MHATPHFTVSGAFDGISGISAVSGRVVAAAKTISSAVKTTQPAAKTISSALQEVISAVATTSATSQTISATAATTQRMPKTIYAAVAKTFSARQTIHATAEIISSTVTATLINLQIVLRTIQAGQSLRQGAFPPLRGERAGVREVIELNLLFCFLSALILAFSPREKEPPYRVCFYSILHPANPTAVVLKNIN
jgi:hypothetical protein